MDNICFDIICIMYFGSFGRILEYFVNFLKWICMAGKKVRGYFSIYFSHFIYLPHGALE
jgi:hypothetical protein